MGSPIISIEDSLSHLAERVEQGLSMAASGFIEVGIALLEARNLIDGDMEFGKWRMENTSVKSSRTASAYMQVAKRFRDAPISGKVSYSILQELVSAPEHVVSEIEHKIDSGEKVTTSDVRDAVRASRHTPEDTDETDGDAQDGPSTPDPVHMPDPDPPRRTARTDEARTMSLEEMEAITLKYPTRKRLLTASDPWNKIGLSQFFENFPSPGTLEHIKTGLEIEFESDMEMMRIINITFKELEQQMR